MQYNTPFRTLTREQRKLTLIEEDLRLKIELQNVKHQFAGLLDNFRTFDRVLDTPQIRPVTRSTNERVDDARARVRALYASKRTRLQQKHRTQEYYDKENRTPTNAYQTKHASMVRSKVEYDTSAWSDEIESLQTERVTSVNINDISRISGKRIAREHTSCSNISGAFHSTFNYPLHSTLNYPLHSTIIENTPDLNISNVNRSKTFSGKRRLFVEEEVQPEVEVEVSISREDHIMAAGYIKRGLKRQTGQAHLSDDVALHRKQMSINETEMNFDNTLVSSNQSNNATCHSLPDISPNSFSMISPNSTIVTSKIPNKSSSTNASSAPQRVVPRNSPITDQSTGSSVAVSSRRSSRRRMTRPSCLRPLTTSVLDAPTPYSLQKCTSVRLHDRAMRKSLKRKMRRFNEDITKLDTNPYDVLVYL